VKSERERGCGGPANARAEADRALRRQANRPPRAADGVSRIDPWSAMKVSFLVAVGLGIATVVMIAVLWMLLSGMGVFDQINSMAAKIIGDSNTEFNILDIARLRPGRVALGRARCVNVC
jgi:hypothetical protein